MAARIGNRKRDAALRSGFDENTAKDMPINVDMWPAQKKSYSEWLQSYMDKQLTQDNPDIAAPAHLQGLNIFWKEYIDWSKDNPEFLQGTLTLFINDADNWVTRDLFPIQRTRAETIMQTMIEIDPEITPIGTRKVPGRLIYSKVSRRQGHTVYRIQGFQADYSFMKTPEGRQEWDLYVDALLSNLWGAIILDGLYEIRHQPSHYKTPQHLYSHQGVPQTVEQAFKLDAMMFCVLNKEHQAMATVSSFVERIFEQVGLTLDSWIFSRADLNFINLKDETNLYTDKSGGQAIRNRRLGAEMTNVLGQTVRIVPILEGIQHNDTDEPVLQTETQRGSMAHFPETGKTIRGGAKNYTSRARDISFPSWTTDDDDHYRFDDFLAHCFQFVPEQGIRTTLGSFDTSTAGQLDRVMLVDMINNATSLFARTKTEMRNNEERFDPMVAYNRHTGTMYPINAYGEMTLEACSVENMDFPAETLEYRIFANFTAEEKSVFRQGLDYAKMLRTAMPTLAGLSGGVTVKATADISEGARAIDAPDSPDSLGVAMLEPNQYGGVTPGAGYDFAGGIPFGYGNISGLMTLVNEFNNGRAHGIPEGSRDLIAKFVSLYAAAIMNLRHCSADHAALDPRLVPLYHNSARMDDMTRAMIVAWYFLFDTFIPPLVSAVGLGATAARADAQPDETRRGADASAFGKYDANMVATFYGYLNETDMGSAADAEKVAKNIDLIAAGFKTLFVNKKTSKTSDKAKGVYDNVQQWITPLTLRDASEDGVYAFMEYVANNQEGLSLVFRSACSTDTTTSAGVLALYTQRRGAVSPATSGPVGGSNLLIWQLCVSPAAIAGVNGAKHAQLRPIADRDDVVWLTRYVVDTTVELDAGACGSAFDSDDQYTYGGTLATALPFVNPLYPLVPRSGNIARDLRAANLSGRVGATRSRAVRFRDGFPAHGVDNQHTQGLYQIYAEAAYNRTNSTFDTIKGAFPELPDFIVQNIACPPTGHPNEDRLTAFERRWIASHDKTPLLGIACRTMAMQTISTQSIRRYYACDVAIPLGGMILRPWEAQITHIGVGLAPGSLGNTYMHDIDNTVAFDSNRQHYTVQVFTSSKAMISKPKNMYVVGNLRGGTALGGKGNEPVNKGCYFYDPDSDTAAARLEAVGNGARLGNFSNVHVLSGYNQYASGRLPHRHVDICGFWNASHFAHMLHESEDFLPRTTPMYSGQMAVNFILKLDYDETLPGDIEQLSFAQLANIRRTNTWCHQVTQHVYDDINGTKEIVSHHPWGRERPGLCGKEQSLTSVKIADNF